MKKLLYNPASIVTVNTNGKNVKRGEDLNSIDVLESHSIVIEDEIIKDIIPTLSEKNNYDEKINAEGKTVLPGLVDCHTHTLFAGSRAEEFKLKISGISYEEIARKGGGILSTVKAVRESSFEELVNIAKPRINNFIAQGITTLEIKSGYGLDFENEIKMLQVINYLNEIFPIDIIPTFLGAHTVPSELKNNRKDYVDVIINKMLPHIAKQNLAVFCDGFCEETAFDSAEIDLIFDTAKKSGLRLKLHTEQFNNIGGLETAIKHNSVSVDHLEVITDDLIQKLKSSDTVAVLLPGVSFFLDYQYAPARKLTDNKITVALATDFNPGSSNIPNLHLIMSLAAIKMRMTIEEIISAVTINASKALCLENSVGSIEIGKKADFSIFNTEEYADIIYKIGLNICDTVIKNGNIIYNKSIGD